MRINEVKETKEVIIKTQYIAEDGIVFYDKEQCEKYEESALFAIKKQLRIICNTNEYELTDAGCEDYPVEVFDIQTSEDLLLLKRYLYLQLQKANASESDIKSCFESTEHRKGYSFDSVTCGHEVIIWWSYDLDRFWVYGDGSIDGYVDWFKKRVARIIYPPQTTE